MKLVTILLVAVAASAEPTLLDELSSLEQRLGDYEPDTDAAPMVPLAELEAAQEQTKLALGALTLCKAEKVALTVSVQRPVDPASSSPR